MPNYQTIDRDRLLREQMTRDLREQSLREWGEEYQCSPKPFNRPQPYSSINDWGRFEEYCRRDVIVWPESFNNIKDTKVNYTFKLTHLGAIDFEKIAEDLSREKPLLRIQSVAGESQAFTFLVHLSLAQKINTCENVDLSLHLQRCGNFNDNFLFSVITFEKHEDASLFVEYCKGIIKAPWPRDEAYAPQITVKEVSLV